MVRVRGFTYAAMGLFMVGALWWWVSAPGTPDTQASTPLPAIGLMAIGVVMYLAGRVWMLWLGRASNRPH